MTPPREHPRRRGFGRRRLEVVRHAEPAEALQAMLEPPTGPMPPIPSWEEVQEAAAEVLADVSRETSVGPFVAGGQVPDAVEPLEVAPLEEEAVPALSFRQRAKLEAVTAAWVRNVRQGGPGPEDTMLYGAPTLPPVPPPAAVPRTPPARVSDWTSRHDPRSLNYPVRARLSKPVPVQDFLLERGPILDQGTTPPLTLEVASACGGMAAVAAANVLRLESRPVYSRPELRALLDYEDAHQAYDLARQRDHAYGDHTAGTSVLGVMKAGQELGWWDTYLWGLGGTRDVAQAILQLRAPVVLGLPWPAGLEAPDAAGIVTPTGSAGMGHMLTAVGIRMARAGRPGPWFVLQQSRGPEEGDAGLVYLHHAHLAQLLAGVGEAAVPLPRWGLQ